MQLTGRVLDVYDVDTIIVLVPAVVKSTETESEGGEKLSTIRVRLLDTRVANCDVYARDALIRLIAASNGYFCTLMDLSTRATRRDVFANNPCLMKLDCRGFDKNGRVLVHASGVGEHGGGDFVSELARGGWINRG